MTDPTAETDPPDGRDLGALVAATADETDAELWAADLFDCHGTYIGTVRIDAGDLDRCANGECNCTTHERIDADALFLTDEDPDR